MIIKTKSFELAIVAAGEEKSAKLAIVIPGRLDTKDYADKRSLINYLAEQGYYAVSFDPPGTWESLGDINLNTTTNILKAISELIEYYGNKPTVLIGHSRGGTNAMLVGTSNPHVTHFVAIMSHHGPTTVGLPKNGAKTSVSHRDIPPGTSRTAEQQEFRLPATYFEDQAQYNVLEDLKDSPKPKLFFYGTEDVLVSPESVKEMYAAAAQPKEIHELESEHDYRLHEEAIEEVNSTVGAFLQNHPVSL